MYEVWYGGEFDAELITGLCLVAELLFLVAFIIKGIYLKYHDQDKD